MSPFLLLAIAALWVYLLWVLRRAELHAWRFLWGSMGLFILMMVGVRPWLTRPLARYVCAIAGVAGRLTGAFTAYFKYGILYIPAAESSVTLQVDFECSGVIEIMAFFSLLAFFNVYRASEKVLVGLLRLYHGVQRPADYPDLLVRPPAGRGGLLYHAYFRGTYCVLPPQRVALFLRVYKAPGGSNEGGAF